MSVRDQKGRFATGNPGGAGRPKRATETEYLQALNETVTLADWRDVVRRAVTGAKSGDARARDWLSRYLVGDPSSHLGAAAAEADDIVFYLPQKDRIGDDGEVIPAGETVKPSASSNGSP